MTVQYRQQRCPQYVDDLMRTIASLGHRGFRDPIPEEVRGLQELREGSDAAHGADRHVRVVAHMEDPTAGLYGECVVLTGTYSGEAVTLWVTDVGPGGCRQNAAI